MGSCQMDIFPSPALLRVLLVLPTLLFLFNRGGITDIAYRWLYRSCLWFFVGLSLPGWKVHEGRFLSIVSTDVSLAPWIPFLSILNDILFFFFDEMVQIYSVSGIWTTLFQVRKALMLTLPTFSYDHPMHTMNPFWPCCLWEWATVLTWYLWGSN